LIFLISEGGQHDAAAGHYPWRRSVLSHTTVAVSVLKSQQHILFSGGFSFLVKR